MVMSNGKQKRKFISAFYKGDKELVKKMYSKNKYLKWYIPLSCEV